VEGASAGIGLGHEFLRHVERTRVLLHLVDISAGDDAIQHFELINQELEKYSAKLAKKPQIVVLSKIDTVDDEITAYYREIFEQKTGQTVYPISAATHQGLDTLLNAVFELLDKVPAEEEVVPIVPDLRAFDNDDSEFTIHRKGKCFSVEGGKIERLFSVTDMRNREAVQRLMNILKAMGVYRELAKAGAEEGHIVQMAGLEFEYIPEDEESSSLR
ncbi:MAG TPA: Obg family GTPase CgtA, partial [Oculatellaceae cyanobacterium]